MANRKKSEDYDLEPVVYCARCYSLKIKYEEAIDSDCCLECGCSDTKVTNIQEWEKIYEQRYGHKYTEKGSNPRNAPIFKMSLSKLKMMVYENDHWRKIAHRLYKNFPQNLSRADSIILLFDKLIKDNRLDDLRFILLEKKY